MLRFYLKKRKHSTFYETIITPIENETLMTSEQGKFLVDGIASELFMI